jgi:hypothetical protein
VFVGGANARIAANGWSNVELFKGDAAVYVFPQSVLIRVGLLTGVHALGQLIFAPVWGRLSD